MLSTLCQDWRVWLLIIHAGSIAACDYDSFDEHLNDSRSTSVIEMRACPDEQVLDARSVLVDVVFSAPMVSVEPIEGELWTDGAWTKDRLCVAPLARENHTNTFSALVRPSGRSTALEVTAWDVPQGARPATGIVTGGECPGETSRILDRRYLLLASAVARDCRTVFEPVIEAGAAAETPSTSTSSDASAPSDAGADASDGSSPAPNPTTDGGGSSVSTSGPNSNSGSLSSSVENPTVNSTTDALDGGSDAN